MSMGACIVSKIERRCRSLIKGQFSIYSENSNVRGWNLLVVIVDEVATVVVDLLLAQFSM